MRYLKKVTFLPFDASNLVIEMSLEKVPQKEKKSRYREWRARRKFGEEINASDIKKIVELNRILRSDGKKLGINQISVEIVPAKVGYMAAASESGYRIKGDGMLSMPSSLTFEYRVVDKLNKEELRSLAWHELGHYIFSYYFPKMDDRYWKDFDHYRVVEAFADEFAYKRFGDVYLKAIAKTAKLTKNKEERKIAEINNKTMRRMAKYRKRYKKPFWIAFAKQLKVKIEYAPGTGTIVGIRPPKSVLKGLYEET